AVLVGQRFETRAARADVNVETERIGARLKRHPAVRDSTIEEQRVLAPHVEQMADVEPVCLDLPTAACRILQLANRKAGLWLDQRVLEILTAAARQIPGRGWRAPRDVRRA